jgi:hypothetical protein
MDLGLQIKELARLVRVTSDTILMNKGTIQKPAKKDT